MFESLCCRRKSVERSWRFRMEECSQRWCRAKVDQKSATDIYSNFRSSSSIMQKSREWVSALFLKGQLGAHANTPLRPNINKLFCDSSSNIDIRLLLIILWTMWSKNYTLCRPGVLFSLGSSIYTQRGLWVQAGTCGISPHKHTHSHTEVQHYYAALLRIFGLCAVRCL